MRSCRTQQNSILKGHSSKSNRIWSTSNSESKKMLWSHKVLSKINLKSIWTRMRRMKKSKMRIGRTIRSSWIQITTPSKPGHRINFDLKTSSLQMNNQEPKQQLRIQIRGSKEMGNQNLYRSMKTISEPTHSIKISTSSHRTRTICQTP